MPTAEEIAREEYEAWCKRSYEGKGYCQDALDLCERVARRVSIEATDGYASQPVVLDVVEMLHNAGYGKPGQPNTLWAMVKAVTADSLALDWRRVEDEKPEPNSQVLCWDGKHYHTSVYAEFGKPGAKPGEGEFIFNPCHWATHWMYLAPPASNT